VALPSVFAACHGVRPCLNLWREASAGQREELCVLWTRRPARFDGRGSCRLAEGDPSQFRRQASLCGYSDGNGGLGHGRCHTIWQQPHGRGSVATAVPLVACDGNGYVYVAMRRSFSKGSLQCYDAQDGSVRWRRETGNPLNLQVTRDYVMVRSSAMEVFDARSGSLGWKLKLPGCAPAAWLDGSIYVLGERTPRK